MIISRRLSAGLSISLLLASLLTFGGCNREDEEVIPTLVNELEQVSQAMTALKTAVAKNPKIPTSTRFDIEFAVRMIESFDLDQQMQASVEDARMSQVSQNEEPLSDALQVLVGANVLSGLDEVQEALSAAALGLTKSETGLLETARGTCRRFYDVASQTAAKRKKPDTEVYNPWSISDMGGAGTVTNPYYVNNELAGENVPDGGRLAHLNPYFKQNTVSGDMPQALTSIVLAPGETTTCSVIADGEGDQTDVSVFDTATRVRKKIFPNRDHFEFTVTAKSDQWSIHTLQVSAKKYVYDGERIKPKQPPVRCERSSGVKPDGDTRPLTKSELGEIAEAESALREADTGFAILLGSTQDKILEGTSVAEIVGDMALLSRIAITHTKTQRARHVLDRIRAAGSVNAGILQVAQMELRTSFAILLGQQAQLDACSERQQDLFQELLNQTGKLHSTTMSIISKISA